MGFPFSIDLPFNNPSVDVFVPGVSRVPGSRSPSWTRATMGWRIPNVPGRCGASSVRRGRIGWWSQQRCWPWWWQPHVHRCRRGWSPGMEGCFHEVSDGFLFGCVFFFLGGIGNQDGTDHEHVHLEAVMFFLGVLPWQGLFLQSRLDELLFPFIGRHVARTGYSVPGPGGGRHRLWHQRIYPEQLVHLFAGAVVSFFGPSENPKATGPMAKPMSVAIFNGHPMGIKGGWKITNKWRLKMETMELNYPLVI